MMSDKNTDQICLTRLWLNQLKVTIPKSTKEEEGKACRQSSDTHLVSSQLSTLQCFLPFRLYQRTSKSGEVTKIGEYNVQHWKCLVRVGYLEKSQWSNALSWAKLNIGSIETGYITFHKFIPTNILYNLFAFRFVVDDMLYTDPNSLANRALQRFKNSLVDYWLP